MKIKASIVILALVATQLGTSLALGERLRFGTPLKTTPHTALPMLAAEEQGFWKEEGLSVEWLPFRGGTELNRAVAAGAVQAGTNVFTSVVQAISRGLNIRAIADMGIRNDFYIWVLPGSRYKEARDLRGAKVGVPALGSVAHAYVLVVVRALALEKEVRIVGAGGLENTVAALKAGALDAVLLTHFAMVPLRYKGEVRELTTMREYLPKKWQDNVIFVRRDFIAKEAEAAAKLIKAFLRAGRYVTENKTWAVDRMKSFSGFPDEAARGVFPYLVYSPNGKIDKEAVENVVKFLIENGVVAREKAPPLDDLLAVQLSS